MDFLVTFLEGIVTFISPCLLPMLPIYLAYFAGDSASSAPGEGEQKTQKRTLVGSLCFVAGFSTLFVALGAAAGAVGGFLSQNQRALDIVCGAIVIVFGLHFMGVLHIGFLDRTLKPKHGTRTGGLFSAFLFGIVFAAGWTPCVGAFLGSALLLASQQGSALHGIALLLAYSAGLGIPFVLSALLVGKASTAIDAIKRHYRAVTLCSGGLLVVVGLLMMTGQFGIWLSALSA